MSIRYDLVNIGCAEYTVIFIKKYRKRRRAAGPERESRKQQLD